MTIVSGINEPQHQQQIAPEQELPGQSFNLDFHSVPYHGEHPAVQRHYVAMRSRRQSSILTFLAQDADGQAFCYSNADLRKGEEADEILRFVAFWEKHHGARPRHLVFDSRLTTYANLVKLHNMGITFMTLRRRSPALLRRRDRPGPQCIPSRRHRSAVARRY